MGLFSNLRNKDATGDSDWSHLLDEAPIPLAELEAATNPMPVPPVAQEPELWHFPDVDFSENAPDERPPVESAESVESAGHFEQLDGLKVENDEFDRRTPTNEYFGEPAAQSDAAATAPLLDRHIGPIGDGAAEKLEPFGLEPGATWLELRLRYLDMKAATELDESIDAESAAELDDFRRELNAGYAAIRLLAAS